MGSRHRTQRRRASHEPGHAPEWTFTCSRRDRFLAAERTCRWRAEAIEEARTRLDFAPWALVFLPEHVPLIVWPRRAEYPIAALLGAIKGPVGRRAIEHREPHAPEWLPRVTRRRGRRGERLFGQSGVGFDRNLWEPATLRAMIGSLHRNPVRRGLVARASEWQWSRAGWSEGEGRCALIPDPIPPEWVPRT